ncbi:hypothetical protein LTR07_001744 [Exophiala xenobiotica]|nr:hypothetical protein LTR90_000695 [Exophiala xenobiotica]KAK5501001.1 hypothetical protein LTR26_000693 [Exophiala xenobiotica]KAK5506142.1 hypothetical protein LTR83_000694 [Exophiala xenobiotica]KAK5522846.1 hypothetical protein LTR21_000693 [Exophiala xenobiotica]KAK5526051.1 hypothetical protein LTR07_001744 [Exophiala xenobiotica]
MTKCQCQSQSQSQSHWYLPSIARKRDVLRQTSGSRDMEKLNVNLNVNLIDIDIDNGQRSTVNGQRSRFGVDIE